MKVLQVINGLGMGGAEKLMIDLVPRLNSNNVETDVVLLNKIGSPFQDQLESNNNIKIQYLGSSYYNLKHIINLIPIIKYYDIVHVHLFPSLYFVALAKVLGNSKVKLVFTEHSTGNSRINSKIFKYIDKFIYSFYKKVFCITPQVKDTLLHHLQIPEQKLVVIENGIDINKINNSTSHDRLNFNYKNTDILLIMVAGFREQKDHETVVKVLTRLDDKYKLILVGEGERKQGIEKLIQTLGIKDRVKFLGNRTDVYSLMKMCDISILSSHWEGFGLVAAESMACKIPTIASNVSGLAEVVEEGGILFEKGNVSSLFEQISRLENVGFYNQVSLSCQKKAQQYDINKMVQNIISQYKNLCTE